jgi:hypothetical protein
LDLREVGARIGRERSEQNKVERELIKSFFQ